jgi:short subunit dehydrogenase-like uncharacterized protein
LTAATAVMALRHVLNDAAGRAGYFTPSQLMGSRCVEQVEDGGRVALS